MEGFKAAHNCHDARWKPCQVCWIQGSGKDTCVCVCADIPKELKEVCKKWNWWEVRFHASLLNLWSDPILHLTDSTQRSCPGIVK